MKKKANNKKIIIAMLIVLLLALAIGYAAFSDILTISGTANAKGTFDLEFQNAEVVKNVGADLEKTTAIISEDKNTLTVNVADLSYPGSGVEFSVDIVNVGTIPAEVQAVTPTNINGSDQIKVIGLDVIKTDHPKIEVGDKCNIHFTVEWPVDSGEIAENKSSISFGLEIEYVQSTGEAFEGNTSHIDTDKGGNTIITNTTTPEEPKPPVKEGILTEIIDSTDYGKVINYKATVKNRSTNSNTEVSNWKVLYNDQSNIYLILDDFLPNNLLPAATRLTTSGQYNVYASSITSLLTGLRQISYWSEFANGVDGATAQGAPTFEIVMKSHNEKHNTNISTDPTDKTNRKLDNTDTLYVSHTDKYNGVAFYRLATESPESSISTWIIAYHGTVGCSANNYYGDGSAGIRPVVILPSTLEGTVGETIEIKQ